MLAPHMAVSRHSPVEERLENPETLDHAAIVIGVQEDFPLRRTQERAAVENLEGRRQEGAEIFRRIAKCRALPVDQTQPLRSGDEIAGTDIGMQQAAAGQKRTIDHDRTQAPQFLRPRRVLACELCQRRHRRLLAGMVVLALLSVGGFGLRVSQRARQLPACVADTSIAEGRRVIDPRAQGRPAAWATVRSVMTAPVSGLALGFVELRGRGLCSVGDPPITLAFVPQAEHKAGSMVGEVFLASPEPRINPVRARLLALHESRHVDQWAVYSHGRAIESIDSGAVADQIVPVEVQGPDGKTRTFDTDEHPRRGLTLAGMAELKPLHPEIEGFTVTAGNAAGVNDAAAALLLMDPDHAASNGVEPLARIRSWAAVGVAPRRTGLAPIDAIPKALARARVAQDDIDLFEINEAFCAVPVATTRALGIEQEICNVNGSGCSLGHPIAATGARMVVSMVHELRRRGARLGRGTDLQIEARRTHHIARPDLRWHAGRHKAGDEIGREDGRQCAANAPPQRYDAAGHAARRKRHPDAYKPSRRGVSPRLTDADA